MGGGDLNSKKSWHPNTMKNQERVWKAEQAATEEKKRILELQRERAEERDRSELNDLAKKHPGSSNASNDSRLHWMYDKPDKKVQQEDYLLGKAIEKNYDQPEKFNQDIIPAVARRVVGSSMLTSADDTQVDLARKIREDPLLLVKERERAARAALLNNPLQRRRLTELLRKEQEQKKEIKTKNKSKKKSKSLDNVLAAKLNALGGEKGIDLATLLASDNSSSDSSSEEEQTKKKKKKKKRSKEKKSKKTKEKQATETDPDSSDNDRSRKNKSKGTDRKQNSSTKKRAKSKDIDTNSEYEKGHRNKSKDNARKQHFSPSRKVTKVHMSESRKRKNESDSEIDLKKTRDNISREQMRHKESKKSRHYYSSDDDQITQRKGEDILEDKMRYNESKKNRRRHGSNDDDNKRDTRRRQSPERNDRSCAYEGQSKQVKRCGMSEEERAARLAAMVAAGAEREVERGRRVAEQRAADAAREHAAPRAAAASEARALPDSLESRIHSNRHYIQRDRRHMNEHFARR